MPFTVPHTIAAGELVTTTTMNNEWGGNVSFLANPPACRLTKSGNQTGIAHATETALTWDQETYDTDSMHSTSVNTSRITFTTAGIYVVTWTFSVDTDTDYTGAYSYLRLGGSTNIGFGNGLGTLTDVNIGPLLIGSIPYKFAATNYVEVMFAHRNTSAGSHAVNGAAASFAATWVGLG